MASNIQNVVSVVTEACDDLLVNAFVDQDVHQPLLALEGRRHLPSVTWTRRAHPRLTPEGIKAALALGQLLIVSPAACLSRMRSTFCASSSDYRLMHHGGWVGMNEKPIWSEKQV